MSELDDIQPEKPNEEDLDRSAETAIAEVDRQSGSEVGPIQGIGAEEGGANGPKGAIQSIGALFAEGVSSMKEMGAAHRAHAEARGELDKLDDSISSQKRELEHRRDVEARFDEIVREETEREREALREESEAEALRARTSEEVAALKGELESMREKDSATERRLKSALEAAEDKERSSRESGRRLQRRLDDATSNLERTMREREEGIAAARKAVKSAEAHLTTLNEEYADIQRNPSANSAGYSVRKRELETEISDAMEGVRTAREDVPRIERETQEAVEAARKAVAEAERPISAAREAFNAVVAAADRARDEYGTAKEDAEKRQKALRSTISEREKSAKTQERSAREAKERADRARAALDEAAHIHAHPEETEELARRLEMDRLERVRKASEVEELAAVERDVRARTRGARARLAAAVIGVALMVILMIAWTYLAR